ncbi:MAG TPA: radical SAM protein, partial [Nitrospirales bacterium]|nr:radical SAM protein [Nitrospirales bacterium]
MRRLKITILDLLTKGPTNSLYARVMNQNLASIMPQVVAVWCEEMGHDVRFVCYTGLEDLSSELQGDADLMFITAFTRSAQLAYAISNQFRQQGTVTVLGGPHARCYPQDAVQYFDYVLGFTDKALIEDVIRDCEPHRPMGQQLSAAQQPRELPGVKERWKFIEPTIDKAPTSFKVVPMIGSMGCPYTCGFCIDATIDYQQLSFDQIRE